MMTTESGCVQCGRPCLGQSCPKHTVPVFRCDDCGEDFNARDLFDLSDGQFCADCVLNHLERVGD